MKKEIIDQLIEKLNEVIDSKSSKLSIKDRERLIVIREALKNAKNDKGIIKAIVKLSEFFL